MLKEWEKAAAFGGAGFSDGMGSTKGDKFYICMRPCVRAHYAGTRARVMNSTAYLYLIIDVILFFFFFSFKKKKLKKKKEENKNHQIDT